MCKIIDGKKAPLNIRLTAQRIRLSLLNDITELFPVICQVIIICQGVFCVPFHTKLPTAPLRI